MKVGIDPKVDFAFKRLFGHEKNGDLLLSLVNAVLDPPVGRRIKDLHLLNPYSLKEAWDDKLSIVDIMAVDENSRKFFIEMQMVAPTYFPKRMLYYWAQRHQEQIVQGQGYAEIRPTIAICFIYSALFPQLLEHHLHFQLREEKQGAVFCDDLSLHVLELTKFNLGEMELRTDLDRWLYFLRYAESMDADKIPIQLDTPEIHRALEDLSMLTQDQIERERYLARKMAHHDEISWKNYAVTEREAGLQKGREEGLEKGIEEGRQEGLLSGALMGRIWVYQKLLKIEQTPMKELEAMDSKALASFADQLENKVNGQQGE